MAFSGCTWSASCSVHFCLHLLQNNEHCWFSCAGCPSYWTDPSQQETSPASFIHRDPSVDSWEGAPCSHYAGFPMTFAHLVWSFIISTLYRCWVCWHGNIIFHLISIWSRSMNRRYYYFQFLFWSYFTLGWVSPKWTLGIIELSILWAGCRCCHPTNSVKTFNGKMLWAVCTCDWFYLPVVPVIGLCM